LSNSEFFASFRLASETFLIVSRRKQQSFSGQFVSQPLTIIKAWFFCAAVRYTAALACHFLMS